MLEDRSFVFMLMMIEKWLAEDFTTNPLYIILGCMHKNWSYTLLIIDGSPGEMWFKLNYKND